jgi:hypothetical protein
MVGPAHASGAVVGCISNTGEMWSGQTEVITEKISQN